VAPPRPGKVLAQMSCSFFRYGHPSRFPLVVIFALASITINSIATLATSTSPVLVAIDNASLLLQADKRPSSTGNVRGSDPNRLTIANSGSPRIAFGSARNGGNHDVFLMDIDGGNQVRLTTSLAYDDQPKWSPDGSKIAFMSGRDGNLEIYTMNADGSAQTRITNNPLADGFPAWSHDGTKLAFVRGNLNKAPVLLKSFS
jgi:Tol biopolymer transport system component